jgi:YbgC/YbaW family acyl-CoA thioester hydrolase
MRSERTASPPVEGGGFEVVERVRWSDVDNAGIIYFGAYSRLLDIAESEFYRSLGFTYAAFDQMGLLLPRVHVEFDFFKPALLDDELVLRPRVTGLGVHSVRMKVNVHRLEDEALLAEASLVLACVDKARKPTPLPAAFAAALRTAMPQST